jgi:hypothetical protein
MKRLPLGIQVFEKVIEGNYLYVDKTAIIHELLTTAGNVVFLSRPRRFGKSLLCSTLGSLFEGKRELFAGLAIDSLDWQWNKHPVVFIDFNAANYADGKIALLASLEAQLNIIAEDHGVTLQGESSSTKLASLVRTLANKYNQRVAVIIDEYDKPLLGTIDAPEIHKQLRDELKAFFGVLKSSDEFLQFSFLTGVTKFSKVSIFSDLNQLDDISFNPKYAALCGITQEELERDFVGGITEFAPDNDLTVDGYKDKLRTVYNGYRFTKKDLTVYNPFGLINHFINDGNFAPYWFESGSPTFLFKLIRDQRIDIVNLGDLTISQQSFTKFDIENLDAVAVLYQSGYLTIKDYIEESGNFKLGYPNQEVSSAFSKQLLGFTYPNDGTYFADNFPEKLIFGQIDAALQMLKEFLASIPYDIQISDEKYYQSLLHTIFTMFGLRTRSEVRIAAGRIDTLVETKKYVYCFEFKLNSPDSTKQYTSKDALEQIGTKEYLTPWQGSGKQLFKVGVIFDYAKRNITDWHYLIEQ